MIVFEAVLAAAFLTLVLVTWHSSKALADSFHKSDSAASEEPLLGDDTNLVPLQYIDI